MNVRGRVKVCRFCEEKTVSIDYKDDRLLRRFVTERGKVIPRRMTGTCARHQRELTTAIKRARNIAVLPYAAESAK
jgi:small subunit ribosomal protein S18